MPPKPRPIMFAAIMFGNMFGKLKDAIFWWCPPAAARNCCRLCSCACA